MKRLIGVLLALAVAMVAGCGVRPENEPTAIAVPAITEPAAPAPERGPLTLTVYFVRDGRLHPVERSVADTSATTALGLLTAGPTRSEITSGVRTAITPQPLEAHRGTTSGAAVVTVTPAFTSITGPNQLLAAAQLVWTITDLPGTTTVQVELDGRPLEVPTDQGLSGAPVGRTDYTTLAPPHEDPTPTPAGDRTTPAATRSPGRGARSG